MTFEYKQFYRRKLPHLHSPGGTLFVTFRLRGSIPKNVIAKWKAQRFWIEAEHGRLVRRSETDPSEAQKLHVERLVEFKRRQFAEFEDILHKEAAGPVWLKDPAVANAVVDSLHYLNDKSYKLNAFCVMSNHVHVVFTPLLNEKSIKEVAGSNPLRYTSTEPTLPAIMQSLKGYTARTANQILQRKGAFWEEESYDHEVRNDDEFRRIVRYVLNNPVKASLVSNWREWRWNWRSEE